MPDTGVNIGSQLLQGFVQGKKIKLEQDRLKQESKTQEELTTHRTRLWELQEKQLQQGQAQHEDMMQYRGEELEVRREGTEATKAYREETIKLKDTYQQVLNMYNEQRLGAQRATAVSGAIGDYSDAVMTAYSKELEMGPVGVQQALATAKQALSNQLAVLGLDEEEMEGIMNQSAIFDQLFGQEQEQGGAATGGPPAEQAGTLDRVRSAMSGVPERGMTGDVWSGLKGMMGSMPSDDDVWDMYLDGAFGAKPTGPDDTPVNPPEREAMKNAQKYLANIKAMRGGNAGQ